MNDVLPHQIATRAIGGVVFVAQVRDPADGESRFIVGYKSYGSRWLSRHRFSSAEQGDAAALVLGDFLGAEVRS